MAELLFYYGAMSDGKSTLALQTDYSRREAGQVGRLFTKNSRDGKGTISSRLGIEVQAIEVFEEMNLYNALEWGSLSKRNPQYVIVDEAQFLSEEQVDQLAWIVDDLKTDVYAFGLLTDFRSELFPGSKRLVELADRIERVQASSLCWCGSRATMNARIVSGVMTKDGPQVAVGDTLDNSSDVRYATLCRKHWTFGRLF